MKSKGLEGRGGEGRGGEGGGEGALHTLVEKNYSSLLRPDEIILIG
jgi:hypothetical protein